MRQGSSNNILICLSFVFSALPQQRIDHFIKQMLNFSFTMKLKFYYNVQETSGDFVLMKTEWTSVVVCLFISLDLYATLSKKQQLPVYQSQNNIFSKMLKCH